VSPGMLHRVRGAPMAARERPRGKLMCTPWLKRKSELLLCFIGRRIYGRSVSHRYTNAVMCACDHMGDISVADALLDITTSSYGRPLVAQLQKRLLLLVSANRSIRCRLGQSTQEIDGRPDLWRAFSRLCWELST
jgi:hypothetical protein